MVQFEDPKKVLVIHFGQLGDVVLGLPAMRAVREHFPNAKITSMTGKSPAEVVRLALVADDMIVVDRVELRDGNPFRSIGKILKLVSDVRRRRFDLVIDLHSLSETNLLGYLARIPRRLYANRENRSLDRLGNFDPGPAPEDRSKHVAERYFDVIRPLGIDGRPESFRFNFADSRPFANLAGSVAIFPGAGHPSRCWPLSRFTELIWRFVYAGDNVTIFLGPEEQNLRSEISDFEFPRSVRVVDGLNLADFIAAISATKLFICNDTGPMHLAACTGVPVVLLMDERAPLTYLPFTKKLAVVRSGTLDEVTVDEVFEAAKGLLDAEK